ncbi:C4-dicarboxylate ABC transporter permease [Meridianimarinicoccus roseus]|uniref:TRAP transporter small permease protein n=1 Tax=Meridianimarinicoccus roseus TaxID=2072018 RepID=A0A2V2LC33_9RHOB|nr:TRAP transporter small permease subunit [Meridianimarinicoccus roseus]PWR03008.1 C4-dicarboxylate ABC transporter permease [Meridianimarinicoccus roseus]
MIPLVTRIADGASATVRIIGHVAAWSGLALVLLVAFNVIARYFFGFGTVALQELEWHVMAVSALFGMSYGLNQGGEVRVDVLYSAFPPRVRAMIDLAAHFALCAVALVIAYLCIAYVEASYSIDEGSPDPGGLGYRYVLKAALPAAFALLALQALAMVLHGALRLVGALPLPETDRS